MILRGALPLLAGHITFGIFWIVDCVLIFSEDRRCAHDFLAGTVVVDPSRLLDVNPTIFD